MSSSAIVALRLIRSVAFAISRAMSNAAAAETLVRRVFGNKGGIVMTLDGQGHKGGPCAGLGFLAVIFACLTDLQVPGDVAVTGCLSNDLNGGVGQVGCIMHKVRTAAAQPRIRRLVLPAANRDEVEGEAQGRLPGELELLYVSNVDEALSILFADAFIYDS